MSRFAQNLRTKVIAGSLVSIVLLLVMPLVYTVTSNEQANSALWVAHTQEVLRNSQSILATLRELQVLSLGRLTTTDRRLVAPWRKAASQLDRDLDDLRVLVSDNPPQAAKAAEVRALSRSWAADIERDVREGPSSATLPDLILGSDRRASVQEIEALLGTFTAEERRLLELRLKLQEAASRRNTLAIQLGSAFAIALTVAVASWLIRSLVRPIRDLTGAARQIREGDLQARVNVRGVDELGLLGEAFNSMAAVLQRNARELEKRDVHSGVLRISEVLATSGDLAHLLEQALERIMDVARCPAGALFIQSPGDETLRVLVASGVGPGVMDHAFRPGEGLVGRAARGRQPLIVPGDSEESPLSIGHWLGAQRPAELAYVPLHSGPELVGVLALANTARFDDRTRNVLQIVSGQLGAAIQNALSRQTLQRQAVELEARHGRMTDQQDEIGRQNDQLRAASQLKSEFLANMSHELRTPLTIILGFTNTVLRGAQGPLNPEQQDSLRRVHDNGKQLLSLINDILDLSKIEAGQMEVDPGPVDFAALIRSVGENFRALARTKGLDLRDEIDPGLPAIVQVDEARLRQILMNLVGNAVKFTDRGLVEILARRHDETLVEVEVRDTGPGIAQGDIPRIFEQFRQLDGKTTRKAGGTGLGLSIVKRLVELLGGTLEVRSAVGHGSSFLVRLPVMPHSWAPLAAPEPPGRREGGLVLAIDDDEQFQSLLRESLRDTPFELRTANTGREGLELAARLRPSVITLDVMMPQMDGWNVLGALKSSATTADIPVVMLSILQRRGLGMILGASDYLTKPVDRDRLIRALERAGASQAGGPILVVDDDPDVRKMLEVELRAAGFRVHCAADGVEAVRMARAERPSAVILDLMMPNMDGFEVAAELRKPEGSTAGVPILVLTAKDLTVDDIRRLNGQIEEIFQKGALNVDALVARLVSVLNSLGISPPAGAPDSGRG